MDSELSSPAFVVDLDRARANTKRMALVAHNYGLALRPHVKTHKTLEGAHLQCSDGEASVAAKIVTSTLMECEFMAQGGFEDILYGVLLEPSKFARAWRMHTTIHSFHVLLDSPGLVAALEAFVAAQIDLQGPCKRPLSVFLAVDATNYHREGVAMPALAPAVDLAQMVDRSAFLSLAGIYSHSGNSYNTDSSAWHAARAGAARVGGVERDNMLAVALAIRERGIVLPVVSVGATPALSSGIAWPRDQGFELHPGNYIFYDRQQVESGSCRVDDIACYVVARVLAVYPARNEFLIDAGGCALHKDSAGLRDGTWGCLIDDNSLVLKRMTQEVAVVGRLDDIAIDFTCWVPGRPVRVLPNHSCMTAACHNVYHVVEGPPADSTGARAVTGTWTPTKFWH